jgi:15-cis-phytoene desaturase
VKNTDNFRYAKALSQKLAADGKNPHIKKKTVAVIGGGLSGLACAKYLADAGHTPTGLIHSLSCSLYLSSS